MTWTVEVEYHLSAGGSLNCCSVTPSAPNKLTLIWAIRWGHRHHMGEVVGRDVKNVARRRFWNHQSVAGARGMMSRKASALASS